jgi:predicted TIM-barrel fold metal-dependent hydrolase
VTPDGQGAEHLEPFVDAHHHLWDLGRGRYGWLQEPFRDRGWGDWEPLRRDYLAADYAEDAAGLDLVGSVHIQVSHDLDWAFEETRWVSEIAGSGGLPSAIVAYADLGADDAVDQLYRQSRYERVRGIRQVLNWHPRPELSRATVDHLRDPRWREGFALLPDYDLAFDAQVYPHQHTALAGLCAEHPQVTVLLDHCGLPPGPGEPRQAWAEGLRELASLPNVWAKVSGFGMTPSTVDAGYVAEIVQEVVTAFGPSRVLLGSNFPVDGLRRTYRDTWAMLQAAIAGWSPSERRSMLVENAQAVYRFGPGPSAPQAGRSSASTIR